MVAIGLRISRAGTCGTGQAQRRRSILKLLGIRILIIVMLLLSVMILLPRHFEVLLLFNQCMQCLVELEEALGEGVVALPDHTLRPLIESINIQVLISNHMDEILKGIFVNADWRGVHSMNIDHVAGIILQNAKDVNCILRLIDAAVGRLEWHQLIHQRRW